MTIKEAKTSSIIPNSLSDEDLFLICKKLGINATNEDYDLNMDEFDKLRFSSDILSLKIKEEVTKSHNIVINRYNELIGEYKRLLNSCSKSEYKSNVQAIIFKLEKERLSYENNVKGFNSSEVDISFDYGKDIDKKIEDIVMSSSNKIKEANASLEKLNKKLQAANERIVRCKNGKLTRGAKTKALESRLEDLRLKPGKLNTVQNKVLNPNVEKYIDKILDRHEKYRVEQRKVNSEVSKKQAILDEISDYTNVIEMASEEIKGIQQEQIINSDIINIPSDDE